LDLFLLLQAPGFDVIEGWRRQQEHALRERTGDDVGMSDAEVARFIQFYERLSRHIAREAPQRADVVVSLDARRQPIGIEGA
jgi:D-glycerate 3-kinase